MRCSLIVSTLAYCLKDFTIDIVTFFQKEQYLARRNSLITVLDYI